MATAPFSRQSHTVRAAMEGSAIAIGDVNGDGRPDLIVTNACGNNENSCRKFGRLGSCSVKRDLLRLENRAHRIA